MKQQIIRWAALGCTHIPVHDPEGVDWALSTISKHRPDYVIHLGDLFDADCISIFNKNKEEGALKAEYEAANSLCKQMNKRFRKARKVWMQGNHEERMFRGEFKHLSDLLDYRKHIDAASDWKHIEYVFNPSHTFSLGQVTFGHGWHVGVARCKWEAIALGVPYGLHVYAHTHRPHNVHRIRLGTMPLPYWHINVGTFIAPKPDYMKRKDDSLWGQGVVLGVADTRRRYDGKQNWQAGLKLRQMYWDGEIGAA